MSEGAELYPPAVIEPELDEVAVHVAEVVCEAAGAEEGDEADDGKRNEPDDREEEDPPEKAEENVKQDTSDDFYDCLDHVDWTAECEICLRDFCAKAMGDLATDEHRLNTDFEPQRRGGEKTRISRMGTN